MVVGIALIVEDLDTPARGLGNLSDDSRLLISTPLVYLVAIERGAKESLYHDALLLPRHLHDGKHGAGASPFPARSYHDDNGIAAQERLYFALRFLERLSGDL